MNEAWMPFYYTYISLRLCLFGFGQHITKMLPIIAYTLFQPCYQVSQRSPRHVFWYRWNLFRNCELEVIDDTWFSGVHFRFEVYPKEIVTNREIRRAYRPWKLAAQWSNVFRKHFPNDTLAVRTVAPSRWNHMVESSFPRRLSSGVRKFRIIST
jgi:hypothetical protein